MEEPLKGLNRVEAAVEAERCLYCFDSPCEKACPVHVPIPEFIHSVRSNNIQGAREIIETSNPFIETCGILCPQENFCQSVCVRKSIDSPVRIRELHRYVTDNSDPSKGLEKSEVSEKKVAIIGGGPAGLTAARELGRAGIKTVIFEKKDLGGVPLQQISSFRFPQKVGEREIKFIHQNFITEVRDKKITELSELGGHFDAIFIATGLQDETTIDVKGKELPSVTYAVKVLKTLKSGLPSNIGKQVGIIGGGNVAFEVAIALKIENPDRDVKIIYRRSLKEVKAFKSEVDEAIRVGVTMQFLATPVEIRGTDHIEGILVRQTRLLREDETGRRRFEEIPNSDFLIPLDSIVIAIGQSAAPIFSQIEKTEEGLIKVDENFMTSVVGVFAGGDIIRGSGTIVESVSDGKKAAESILKYIKGGKNV